MGGRKAPKGQGPTEDDYEKLTDILVKCFLSMWNLKK